MAKIIKHGKFYLKDFRFVCSTCGCVFEESAKDFSFLCFEDFSLNKRVLSVSAKCPECGQGCYTNEELDG